MPQRKKFPVTSSATRSKRLTKKPVTTSARRANRQKASTAKMTKGGQGVSGSARVTTGRGRSGPKLPKLPSKSRRTVTGTGRKPRPAMPKESAARKAARLANRAAKGYGGSAMGRVAKKLAGKAITRYSPLAMAVQEGLTARNTAKGTLTAARRRGDYPYKPKKKKR